MLAPAFPYQGRVTRDGRQYARDRDGAWVATGPDLVAALRAAGVAAQLGDVGADLLPGVTVFDAETDADLRLVAEAGRRWPDPLLWSGSGGLAQALAHGTPAPARPPWPLPVLGLFGTDQDATAAQLAACDPFWLRLPHDSPAAPQRLRDHLAAHGVALASLDLPPGLSRDAAARAHRAGDARADPWHDAAWHVAGGGRRDIAGDLHVAGCREPRGAGPRRARSAALDPARRSAGTA